MTERLSMCWEDYREQDAADDYWGIVHRIEYDIPHDWATPGGDKIEDRVIEDDYTYEFTDKPKR